MLYATLDQASKWFLHFDLSTIKLKQAFIKKNFKTSLFVGVKKKKNTPQHQTSLDF